MAKRRSQFDPAIHRVPLDKLRIFEITEAELESLERASPGSILFNLAVATISVALSFSIALTTTKIDSLRTFCVFVIVTVVAWIAGITFSLFCFSLRKSLKSVSKEIRSRIPPPEGFQEQSSNAV